MGLIIFPRMKVNQSKKLIVCIILPALLMGGCQLKEIRSKTKFGPEFRHKGSNSTNAIRWTVQQGFDFKWKQGISTGITYRRRDVSSGSGDNDNGVWLDFSFPIWVAKKKNKESTEYIQELETRIAKLEAMYDAVLAKSKRDSAILNEPVRIVKQTLPLPTNTH